MRRVITILIIALLLPCCRDDRTSQKSAKSAEERKIEKEVARRVEVVKSDLKTKEYSNRLRTIRIVGFVFLSTAAVGGLLWVHHPRFPNPQGRIAPVLIPRPPEWIDHSSPPAGRVLDLNPNPQPPDVTQSPIAMQSQPPRRRRRHETPRRS